MLRILALVTGGLFAFALVGCGGGGNRPVLLNVAYDPTREL
jgi:hypothetical protein